MWALEGAGAWGVSQWWRCVVARCGGGVSAMVAVYGGALTLVGASDSGGHSF